ncbi:MAG: DNA polymerase III subunit beta [Ignavibacteria bacterium]|nr:DNA polymerase III subunit beta [Ignavibacteria bacterium]MBK7444739.1 DNA polymerase III subunit beta [Ignavibacteria bacterium]MBK8383720.1 DNA polymerase III subunit beta [Ignavibacteria bacterium]MBK9403787.1 DNA polymerase III subunit beta [Ignavibacteria bacterium]MBL0107389.1 DNA polymerase III subunit beta [Ignavibacteria bacterium]
MKFSVTGDKLVDALSKLNSVIPTRSPLPILDNILFELNGNELKLLASDLEIFIRTTLEVDGKKDGKVAIPAKRLLDISRTLTTASLTLDVNDKNRISIKTTNGKYSIGGEPAEDFPVPEEKAELHRLELDGQMMKRCLAKTIHAVNTDELRRNMSGVLMDVNQNELKFVATDGFRLAKIIKDNFKPQGEVEEKIIIPLKTGNIILKLNNNDDTILEFDDIDLKVTFAGIEIYSKLIDDTFPSYENVIPKDNDKKLKIKKSELSDSLRRALIFADAVTKRVKLEITNNSIQIKADNPEIGSEGEETIECSFISNDGQEDFDKTPFVIAFNSGYLLDAVSQMETDEINVSFGSPSKAAIATPSEQLANENFIELIMPVRVG